MNFLGKMLWGCSFCAVTALAAKSENFVSNFTYAAGAASTTGSIWVVSRGNAGSGVSLVSLTPTAGSISYSINATELLPDSLTPVQDVSFRM